MNSIVIGFTGGTGSGKTTLAQRLNEVFKNNSVIIKQDSYYKDFPDKTFEERVQINYDHPDSFDMERFTDDVRRLKAGETIECPVYNYAEYKRDKETVTVEPKRIIILEGLLGRHHSRGRAGAARRLRTVRMELTLRQKPAFA